MNVEEVEKNLDHWRIEEYSEMGRRLVFEDIRTFPDDDGYYPASIFIAWIGAAIEKIPEPNRQYAVVHISEGGYGYHYTLSVARPKTEVELNREKQQAEDSKEMNKRLEYRQYLALKAKFDP